LTATWAPGPTKKKKRGNKGEAQKKRESFFLFPFFLVLFKKQKGEEGRWLGMLKNNRIGLFLGGFCPPYGSCF
jgi:hypothetical protein